jgi:hypothetical protein
MSGGKRSPWWTEEGGASGLLGALAAEGRLRAAARALAADELADGLYADEAGAGAEAEAPLRLAAQDLEDDVQVTIYAAEGWVLRLEGGPAGARLTQVAGPPGASLRLVVGGVEAWLPLEPGQPAAAPPGLGQPAQLELWDAEGGRAVLVAVPRA